MGDNNTGGGGSVQWSIDVKHAGLKAADGTSTDMGQQNHGGHDLDGEVGDLFTVSIKVPGGDSAQAYINELKTKLSPDGNRIFFNLPIEKHDNQIRVSWGESDHHKGEANKQGKRIAKT